MFIPLISFGQQPSCEDISYEIESSGLFLDVTCTGGYSSAINCIRWYVYNQKLFAAVRFKSYGKYYMYGGWEYDFDSYYDFKKAFEDAESAGTFFNQNIKSAKIKCE